MDACTELNEYGTVKQCQGEVMETKFLLSYAHEEFLLPANCWEIQLHVCEDRIMQCLSFYMGNIMRMYLLAFAFVIHFL